MSRVELYRFAESTFADPFDSNQNFYFVLDKSGSMDRTVSPGRSRMDIAKEQLNQVLDEINERRRLRGITVHIGICAFSSSSTVEIIKRSASEQDIGDLKAWVNALTTGGGTPFDTPMQFARDYFLQGSSPDYRQSLFFITDGLPEPETSAQTASTLAADMISKSGPFSVMSGNAVDIYCMSIDLDDISYLRLLDNTPRDGIPVIHSTNSDSLYNAIMNASLQEGLIWNWTSGQDPVQFNGELYVPTPISRGQMESKDEISKANIEIELDLDNPMGRRWLSEFMDVIITLSLYEQDEDDDIHIVWKGRLASVKPAMSEIKLSFESVFTSLRRPGLRARYQRSCRHMLYGRGCALNKELWAVRGTLVAATSMVATVPEAASYPDGWFTTGVIEAPDGTLRFIAHHEGDTITLLSPSESLAKAVANDGYGLSYGMFYGGAGVRLFPGCDRTRSTCDGKYNNLNNYGGFDWIPTRNPFDGSSII